MSEPYGAVYRIRYKKPSADSQCRRKLPGYELTSLVGAFASAGTPKSIIDKLNADIQKLLRMQKVSEKQKAQVLDPMFMTPDQFRQRVRSDYEKYGKVTKLDCITPD